MEMGAAEVKLVGRGSRNATGNVNQVIGNEGMAADTVQSVYSVSFDNWNELESVWESALGVQKGNENEVGRNWENQCKWER